GSSSGVYGTNLSNVSRLRSIGVQGVASGSNYTNMGVGVWAEANGTGTAGVNNYWLYGTASNASGQNYAAWLNGRVRITDGTEGAGKVLTSDAAGNASWQTLSPKVSLRVGGTSTITVPTHTFVDIVWNFIEFEEGGFNYNPLTGEYTVPVSGLYFISAKYVWDTFSNNTGHQNTIILVNNIMMELGANATSNTSLYIKGEARAILQLNAGDVIKIQAYQTTGASASIGSFPAQDNNFIIYRIH
ncbi:MAG: hypothetical protein N2747_08615, partial [Chitinophagaceae bacterium]|nr:hypothetical protein [Chitinophagaceae bacterium]